MSDLTAGLAGAGGILGLAGGITGAINTQRQQTRFRRRQRAAINEAREFTDQRLAELLGEGSLFSEGVDFLRGTFGNAADSPLAQDFVKQIRAAQAARGTFSGVGAAAAEAGGLAAFSQELRSRLLPQLQSFAFAPEQLRQSILGFEAPLRVSARTGAALPGIAPPPILPDVATSALNSSLAGLLGGAQVGISATNLRQQQEALDLERAKQQRQDTALASGNLSQLAALIQQNPGILSLFAKLPGIAG